MPLENNHVVAVFAIAPVVIAFFLFVFSIVPISGCGWTSAFVYLQVINCFNAGSGCITEPVRFQLTTDPFYASILFNSAGSLQVQSIAWSSLNTKDLCETPGELNSNYAVPNNFCNNATNTFMPPGDIPTMQALSIVSILLCVLMIPLAIASAACQSKKVTCCVVTTGALLLALSSMVLALWDSFSVPHKYLSKESVTAPLWNATLKYEGQVLVRSKHSSHWEDVYSYFYTDTLVGSPPLIGMSTGAGYSLWISGIVFVVLMQIVLLATGCNVFIDFLDSRSDSFGSGAYRPTSSGDADANASFVPLKKDDDPEVPPPAYPPPPPPEPEYLLSKA